MSSSSKRRRSQPAQIRTLEGSKSGSSISISSSKEALDSGRIKSPGDEKLTANSKNYILSKDHSIEGATLESAIELLSSSGNPASAGFLYEFLMTYRSFATPVQLIGLLKQRLTPPNVSGSDLALIRLRVVNILKNWINHCPQDWDGHELPMCFETIVATAQEDAVLLKHLEPLKQLIVKARDVSESVQASATPKVALPLYRVQNQLKVFNETPNDVLVDQFTAIEIELYEGIAPWDLICWARSSDQERESNCPRIWRFVDRYYEVGHFVATMIVSESELEDRIALVVKFIDMARLANDIGNYNLLMALYSGLSHPVLKRLHITWENVPHEKLKLLNSFIKYCDPEDNFEAMRLYIERTIPVRACLPFLGGYLAELNQINTATSDYLSAVSTSGARLINYSKHRKLYNIILQTRKCNPKVPHTRKDSVLSIFKRLHAMSSDGIKLKAADLNEGSVDIFESSESVSPSAFDAVATPRYPASHLSQSQTSSSHRQQHSSSSDGSSKGTVEDLYQPNQPKSKSKQNSPKSGNQSSIHNLNSQRYHIDKDENQELSTSTDDDEMEDGDKIDSPTSNTDKYHSASSSKTRGSKVSKHVKSRSTGISRKGEDEIGDSSSGDSLKFRNVSSNANNSSSSTAKYRHPTTISSETKDVANNNNSGSNNHHNSHAQLGHSSSLTSTTTAVPTSISTTTSAGKLGNKASAATRVSLKTQSDPLLMNRRLFRTNSPGPMGTTTAAAAAAASVNIDSSPAGEQNFKKLTKRISGGAKFNASRPSSARSQIQSPNSNSPSSETVLQRNVNASNTAGNEGNPGDLDDSDSMDIIGETLASGQNSLISSGLSIANSGIAANASFGYSHLHQSGGGHLLFPMSGTSPPSANSGMLMTSRADTSPIRGVGTNAHDYHPHYHVDPLNLSGVADSADDSPNSPKSPTNQNPNIPGNYSSIGTPHSASASYLMQSPTSHPLILRRTQSPTILQSPMGSVPNSARSQKSSYSNPESINPRTGMTHLVEPVVQPPISSTAGVYGLALPHRGNEFKLDGKRYQIAMELLEMEELYVHYLKILVEDGIGPLKSKIDKLSPNPKPSIPSNSNNSNTTPSLASNGSNNNNNNQTSPNSSVGASNPLASSNSTNVSSSAKPSSNSESNSPRISMLPANLANLDSHTPLNDLHLKTIFSNIEALCSFHSLFLEDLHNVLRYWRIGGLGALFSQYHQGFEAYIEYSTTRIQGDLLLEHIMNLPYIHISEPIFGIPAPPPNAAVKLLHRQQEVVLSKTGKVDYQALLKMPVHYIPRALLLLKDFKNATSEGHPELPIISDAINKLEHIAMKLPMTQEDAEQSILVLQVLNRITGWSRKTKIRPGRRFEGEFDIKLLLPGTNRFPKLTALLWSDVLMLCKQKESKKEIHQTLRKDGHSIANAPPSRRQWSVLGRLNLTHVHLNLLTTKQARQRFRELSSAENVGGPSVSWSKHPFVVELQYLGIAWVMSFSSVDLGELFVQLIARQKQKTVAMYASSLLADHAQFQQQLNSQRGGTNNSSNQLSSFLPPPCESAAIACIGPHVYMFGGSCRGQWKNDIFAWNINDRQWTKLITSGEPPLARTEHAMCALGSKLYIHGGQRFGSYINDMYSFDTITNTWQRIELKSNQQPPPMDGNNGNNNSAYLSSGFYSPMMSPRSSTSSILSYGSSTSTLAYGVPSPRSGHSLNAINGKLYLFGGQWFETLHTTHLFNDFYVFEPETQLWSEIKPNMNGNNGSKASPNTTSSNASSSPINNPVVSSSSSSSVSSSTNAADINSNNITVNSLKSPRENSSTPGWNSSNSGSNPNHPNFNSPSPSNVNKFSIPAPRQRHVAQVLDDKLVIFGGSGLSSELNDICIYHPSKDYWEICTDVYGHIPCERALAGSAVFGKKLIIFAGAADRSNIVTPGAPSSSSSNVVNGVSVGPQASSSTAGNSGHGLPSISSITSHARSSSTETFNDLFVFDIEDRKWSHCWIPVELLPRRAHSMVSTPDNTLSIFCGRIVHENGDSESTSDVVLLRGLSNIINNATGRPGKISKLRSKCEKLANFAIQQQALASVIGSQYVTPVSSEGVKWDPLTTKSSFTLLESIGVGYYGQVYKAVHEPTSTHVAIKVISHSDCSLEKLDMLAEEMIPLSSCRHAGLVHYHGFAPVSSDLWIVSELTTGDSCDQIMKTIGEPFNEKQVSAILVTVLESLAYLHSQFIVHQGIKASNVIINRDGRVKLTDWGLSEQWRAAGGLNFLDKQTSLTAPELISSGANPDSPTCGTPTFATDIYDVGLMVTGLLESSGPSRQLRARYKFSAETLDFVALCTASLPHRRPTAIQLLSHPFILPQLQNARREEALRSLFSEAAGQNYRGRHVRRGSSEIPSVSTTPLNLSTNSATKEGSSMNRKQQFATSPTSSSTPKDSSHASREKRKSIASTPSEEAIRFKVIVEEIREEHRTEKENLQTQIESLRSENAALESRLVQLEKMMFAAFQQQQQ